MTMSPKHQNGQNKKIREMTTEEQNRVFNDSVKRLKPEFSRIGVKLSSANDKTDIDGIAETLQHALEALAWHDGLNFEMDDYKIGERIEATLANLGRKP